MLEFWFEFASPYSYVAAMQIGNLCRDAGVRLRWRAFLLGPIFELQGWNTSHFNLNPLRGRYMWRDLERLTQKYDLPWQRSAVFPKKCVLAARVAAAFMDEPWVEGFVKDAFVANFGDDRDLDAAAVVLELLTPYVSDPEQTLQSARSEPRALQLRKNTERAIELGIFGAPNCVVDGELFWGEEAMEDALAWARRTLPR